MDGKVKYLKYGSVFIFPFGLRHHEKTKEDIVLILIFYSSEVQWYKSSKTTFIDY
jgi:quercetin dioxygenase-like cupin family protein